MCLKQSCSMRRFVRWDQKVEEDVSERVRIGWVLKSTVSIPIHLNNCIPEYRGKRLIPCEILRSLFSYHYEQTRPHMTRKLITMLLLGIGALLSCTEHVTVERILRDTVWVEKPPIQIVETRRDTVWQTVTVHDTVIVTQHVITTDTVFIEKQIQLIDTVYKDVVKTVTVIEVDTVLVDRVEIVEKRLTIVHPGNQNYQAVQTYEEAINEWMSRVKEAGLEPRAETIVFTVVRWGNPTFGVYVDKDATGIYHATVEWLVDKCTIWRVLSNALLDVPLIEVGGDIVYYGDWWEGGTIGLQLKPHYDHMMFVFFPADYYDRATPEHQDWYWEDMLNSRP